MKSVNPNAIRSVIATGDEALPPEQQTVFELTQISMEEHAYLQNLARAPGTMTWAALNLGLAGAKNLFDANGVPVVFRRDDAQNVIVGKKKPWADPVLTYIPPRERDRLAAEIYKGVGLEEVEAKNS